MYLIRGFLPIARLVPHWLRRCAAPLLLGIASLFGSTAQASPCMVVTLTGTQGGPNAYAGLAGPGTLVRYGDEANDCSSVLLQFDAGRGTSMRLSQLGVTPGRLDALFFTHLHSDHVDGFADLMQLRWHFESKRPKLGVICAADSASRTSHVLSCRALAKHIGDAYVQSGEIAQRVDEDKTRPAKGPSELTEVIAFPPTDDPKVVWSSGAVRVSAVRSAHIAGHVSFRVDTPVGSVVIGGDAGSDIPAPPRASSTSETVETLAAGAQIVVHSAIHPVMAPGRGSGFPAPIYHRQSNVNDLGAMAKRSGATHLMLTHLIPPLGAVRHGPYSVPGGPLTPEDYRQAATQSGYAGSVIVGTDLASVRLPAK